MKFARAMEAAVRASRWAVAFISLGCTSYASSTVLSAEQLLGVADLVTVASAPDDVIAYQVVRANAACNCYRSEWRLHDMRNAIDVAFDGSDESALQRERDGREKGLLVRPSLLWSPDGKRLLYMKQAGGSLGAFIHDRATGKSNRVHTGTEEIFEVAWSDRADEILITVGVKPPAMAKWEEDGRRNGFRFDDSFLPLYQLKPLVSKQPPSMAAPADPSTHDHTSRQMASALKVVHLGTGEIRDATADEVERFKHNPYASVIAETPVLALSGANGATTAHLEAEGVPAFGIGGYRLRLLMRDKELPCGELCGVGVQDIFWNEKRRAFVFSRIDEKQSEFKNFYLYSVAARKPRWLARVSVGDSSGTRCTMTTDDLVCIDEAASAPPQLNAISLEGRGSRVLVDPNAELRGKLPNRVERVVSNADFGEVAYGYLVYPADYEPGVRYPLVVVSYVCSGFLKGGTGNEYPIFPLANAGMIVFCLSWPTREPAAWKAWERNRRAVGLPARYPTLSLDKVGSFIGEVTDELDRRGAVDRTKVALTGLSAGAVFVAYSLAQGQKYAAAVMSSGANDPIDWYLQKGDWMWSRGGHPFPTTNPDFLLRDSELWNQRSIARNADRIHVPLLINAAEHEYLSALQTQAAYKHTQRPFELWVHTDEYHVKWQPAHRLAIYKRNIDWLGFWLLGRRGVPPENDPDQFNRWEEMRVKMMGK